jgi:hypothetical protein
VPSLDLRVLVLERWRRQWDDDWSQRSFVYGGGSGSIGRVALWLNPNQLTSDLELYYDSNLNRFGIGTATPTAPLTFSTALGPKIDLWHAPGAGRYGIGIQNGQVQIYADPAGQVRLGNMDAAGTTFTPRFDVYPTYTYSSVPMGVAWGLIANYELTTNRLYAAGTSYIGQLGVQVTPEPASYALATNGIHCYTFSRFESSVTVAGALSVAGGSTLSGNNVLHGFLAVNGAIDTRWTMRLYGSLYTDANVMIGTNLRVGSYLAPENKLHVDPGGYTYIGNQAGISTFPHPNWGLIVGAVAGSSLYCYGNIEANAGLLVYGTTTLSALTVNGAATINNTLSLRYAKQTQWAFSVQPTDNDTGPGGNCLFIAVGGGIPGYIQSTATTTAYVTTSDGRLKEQVEPLPDALATVLRLDPVRFRWKVDGSVGHGLLAQAVQAVVPGVVSGAEEGETPLGIDYSKLVPWLIGAIKTLGQRVETLEGG